MTEINLERDLLSPTSQADPLNDTDEGDLRLRSSEGSALADIPICENISENPHVSVQLESVIKAAKDAKKKAEKEKRRNKKKMKGANPDINGEQASSDLINENEAAVKPSRGLTDKSMLEENKENAPVSVSKSEKDVSAKPSMGSTDKSNAVGVRLRK